MFIVFCYDVFLHLDGEFHTVGSGQHGQLGHGIADNVMIPMVVQTLKDVNILQIACGTSHTMIVVRGIHVLWFIKLEIVIPLVSHPSRFCQKQTFLKIIIDVCGQCFCAVG